MRKAIFAALFLASCAAQTPTPAPAPPAASAAPCPAASAAAVNATLWMQTSAEYQAVMKETYRAARTALDLALADPAWSALPDVAVDGSKPPAIVLDLDETAIDTSAFQSRQIRSERVYSEESWKQFAAAGNSRAIAPALEFLQYAASRGVAIFYVTNRNAGDEPPLRANLIALGFPLNDATRDAILARGERPEWTSDKSSRRLYVASNYRLLLLLGDDLNDFVAAAGKPVAERAALLQRYDDRWGRSWFLLPNPMYGSWERAVASGATGDCAQYQKKIDTLRTDESYKP